MDSSSYDMMPKEANSLRITLRRESEPSLEFDLLCPVLAVGCSVARTVGMGDMASVLRRGR